jgi:hypothetical protein
MATYDQDNATAVTVSSMGTVSVNTRTLTAPADGLSPATVFADASRVVNNRTLTASDGRASQTTVEAGASRVVNNRTLTAPDDVSDTRVEPRGFMIPTGNFRDVTVWLQNEDGEPLQKAKWVQSSGLFPTASRVKTTDDGRKYARLWLLNADYEQFTAIAESQYNGLDLVWYELTDGDGGIDDTQREATLQFEETEPPGGLSIGKGVSFG